MKKMQFNLFSFSCEILSILKFLEYMTVFLDFKRLSEYLGFCLDRRALLFKISYRFALLVVLRITDNGSSHIEK